MSSDGRMVAPSSWCSPCSIPSWSRACSCSRVGRSVGRQALAEDRQDMVTPAATATKAGDTTGAAQMFVDAVNAQPGNFDALPPGARSIILDNASTLPLHFAAPPPPEISCTQLGQIKAPVAIARGELTRPIFIILADWPLAVSQGHDS